MSHLKMMFFLFVAYAIFSIVLALLYWMQVPVNVIAVLLIMVGIMVTLPVIYCGLLLEKANGSRRVPSTRKSVLANKVYTKLNRANVFAQIVMASQRGLSVCHIVNSRPGGIFIVTKPDGQRISVPNVGAYTYMCNIGGEWQCEWRELVDGSVTPVSLDIPVGAIGFVRSIDGYIPAKAKVAFVPGFKTHNFSVTSGGEVSYTIFMPGVANIMADRFSLALG